MHSCTFRSEPIRFGAIVLVAEKMNKVIIKQKKMYKKIDNYRETNEKAVKNKDANFFFRYETWRAARTDLRNCPALKANRKRRL